MENEKILGLLADYLSRSITEEGAKELHAWIKSSPENRLLFEKYLQTHNDVRETVYLSQRNNEKAKRELFVALKHAPRIRFSWRRLAAAACLVILICSVSIYLYRSGEQPREADISPGRVQATLELPDGRIIPLNKHSTLHFAGNENTGILKDSNNLIYINGAKTASREFHTITVPKGGEFRLTLADGSEVWMNSGSRLRYPVRFADHLREVFMEGEIFADVIKDPERPFVLNTPQGKVTVLGTRFNVSSYPEKNNMITTLVNGKVEVEIQGEKAILDPGEQAVWAEGKLELRDVDTRLYTSWTEGIFEFENLSLQEIMEYIARWYNIEFEFTDPAIQKRRFTGGIKKYLPLSESLSIVEETTDVKFELAGSKVKVNRKK